MVALWLCLSVLIAWLLCAAVLTGIGSLLVGRLFSHYSPWTAFWIGLTLCVAILEVSQLFLAIGPLIGLILMLVGTYGFAVNRGHLLQSLRTFLSTRKWVLIAYAAVLICLAIRAAGQCEHYDTGLYGASAVRWIESYPTVPGLANLHGRLGYQSAVFLLVAALHHGPLIAISYRILGGLLLFVAFLQIGPAVERLFFGNSREAKDWFLALLLIPLIFWVGRAEIVGTNTDLPPTILTLLAVAHLFAAFGQTAEPHDFEKSFERLFGGMTLFSLALAFKLSAIAISALGWIVAIEGIRLLRLPTEKAKKLVQANGLLSACLLVPWLIRGIVLSGYPFYPSSLLGLPVNWRVPVDSVTKVRLGVRAWARLPHASLQEAAGAHWLRTWFSAISHNRQDFLFPAGIALAGAMVVLLAIGRRRAQAHHRQMLTLIPALAGLAFWFVNAPALRFGEAAIWSTAAILGATGLSLATGKLSVAWTRVTVLITIVLGTLCLYPRTLWSMSFEGPLKVKQYTALPPAQTIVRQTSSGLEVYIPAEGNQCWEAPLPCAPYFNETLLLRHRGQLGGGFCSTNLPRDAEWQGEGEK